MLPAILSKSFTFAALNTGQACNPNTGTQYPFFGIPHWWKYIKDGELDGVGHCIPKVVIPDGLWAIALAIIDMLLFVAGIVAVVSIIIAGVTYITSGGNAEKGVSARKRIVNSLIGLAVVLIASGLVAFIGNTLGG